ncbi:MAG: ORF6N domain-containing protein, partial [Victivallales bacterium]
MSDILKFEQLQDRIIVLHGENVLIDADIADIYGVETRDINKAVANNPDKFPKGYIAELSKSEKTELVENFHRFNRLKHSRVNPKAFTEKGLYMLATILKSSQAVQATLAIIETFAKIRELSRNIKTLANIKDKGEHQSLMQK